MKTCTPCWANRIVAHFALSLVVLALAVGAAAAQEPSFPSEESGAEFSDANDVVAAPTSSLPLREWGQPDGSTLSARLSRYEALRGVVFLEQANGALAKLALTQLNEADRKYLAESLSDVSFQAPAQFGAPPALDAPAVEQRDTAKESADEPSATPALAASLSVARATESRPERRRDSLDFMQVAKQNVLPAPVAEGPIGAIGPRSLIQGLQSPGGFHHPQGHIYYGCRGTWHIFPQILGTAAYCHHGCWHLTLLIFNHSDAGYDYYDEYGFCPSGPVLTQRAWAFSRCPSRGCDHGQCDHDSCEQSCKYSVWLLDCRTPCPQFCLFDCADRVSACPY